MGDHLPVRHLELLDVGEGRHAHQLPEGLGDERGPRVGGLRSHEAEIELLLGQGQGQDVGRGHGVGPVQGVVAHEDPLVGPQGERLADGVLLRRLGAHGEDGDLPLARGVLQLQGLLDRVLVDWVEDALHRLAIEGEVVLVQLLLRGRVRHALHAHHDVHWFLR